MATTTNSTHTVRTCLRSVLSSRSSCPPHTCLDACCSASERTRRESVQSQVSPAACCTPTASWPPSNLCPPPQWSYYSEQVADGHQEHGLMGKCVIPIRCALFFDYWPWIRRKKIHHADNPLRSDTAVFFLIISLLALRSFTPLVVVPVLRLAAVCVGCTEENKGFAGIMPLQQTKGSWKLAVAPSDTWSALNLTRALVGVGLWKGHCFRVIIFKSLG